jgi:hypothetical protein
MWAVFRYKKDNYQLLRSNLEKAVNDKIVFYNPKISFIKKTLKKSKIITKHILEGYAFCYYEKFKEANTLSKFKYTKGLKHFLDGHILNQNQIVEFISLCKKNEDKNGNLNQAFFTILKKNKIKFLNGPLSNLIFEIIEKNKNKNKIQIKLGEIPLIINKNSNYYYLPI